MMYALCIKICLVRFFLSVEIPKMFSCSVNSNRGCKFFGLLWSSNATGFFVMAINFIRCKTQIFNSIVMLNAIYVIDHIRNITVAKKICNSMSVVKFSVNFKNHIATFIDCANWFRNVYDGKEQARVRVVTNVFKIVFVHAVAPLCNGLKSDGSVLTHRAVATL